MKQLFKEYWIVALIISLIMLMPIAVYIWRFGIIISNQHLKWAEMGSAMSGIYAPILSLLTLVVVGYQVYLQKKFSYLENELHYAEEAKNEVAYYLNLIKTELKSSQLNNPDYINLFAYSPLDSSSNLSNLAKKMYKHNPTIGAAWVNCNTYFCGLKVQDRYPYSTTLTSLSNKAICILSFKTCAALDAYVWHFSNGEINLPQIFYKYCEESSSANTNL